MFEHKHIGQGEMKNDNPNEKWQELEKKMFIFISNTCGKINQIYRSTNKTREKTSKSYTSMNIYLQQTQ